MAVAGGTYSMLCCRYLVMPTEGDQLFADHVCLPLPACIGLDCVHVSACRGRSCSLSHPKSAGGFSRRIYARRRGCHCVRWQVRPGCCALPLSSDLPVIVGHHGAQVHTLLLQLGPCSDIFSPSVTGIFAQDNNRVGALSAQPDRAAGGETSVCSSCAFFMALCLSLACSELQFVIALCCAATYE